MKSAGLRAQKQVKLTVKLSRKILPFHFQQYFMAETVFQCFKSILANSIFEFH